jgi:hypothetical protein
VVDQFGYFSLAACAVTTAAGISGVLAFTRFAV